MSLIEVRLIGLPVPLHAQVSEQSAEVMREFSHLAATADAEHVPARLIALDQVMQERFGAFTVASTAELEEAVATGRPHIDLAFQVPSEVGGAAREVADIWDEVDQYCSEGDYLLALKSPPSAVSYRQWLLGEFTRQAAGAQPLSWPDWERQRSLET